MRASGADRCGRDEGGCGRRGPDRDAGQQAAGFHASEIAAFLRLNAKQLETAKLPEAKGISAKPLAEETANSLREIAAELETKKTPLRLEELERRLTVAEEKLFAVLLAATPDEQIVSVRAEADRELRALPPQNAGSTDRTIAKAICT